MNPTLFIILMTVLLLILPGNGLLYEKYHTLFYTDIELENKQEVLKEDDGHVKLDMTKLDKDKEETVSYEQDFDLDDLLLDKNIVQDDKDFDSKENLEIDDLSIDDITQLSRDSLDLIFDEE